MRPFKVTKAARREAEILRRDWYGRKPLNRRTRTTCSVCGGPRRANTPNKWCDPCQQYALPIFGKREAR